MSVAANPQPRRVWRRWSVLGVLVAIAVGVTVGLVLVFSGDEPEQVDAERALQQDQEPSLNSEEEVEELPDEELGDTRGTDVGELGEEPEDLSPPEEPEDLDGRWVVEHSREFDRVEGRGTFAGYRIREELAGIGNSVAVGRSPEVEGEVIFEAGAVTAAFVEVDLTALVSDDGRRDARVRNELGDDARARFVLDDRIELPEVPPVGEVIELTVPGQLTITDTTNDIDVDLQVVVTETGLLVAGSTRIDLDDYDVEVPSARIVLSVENEATIEWQLFFVRD